VKALFKVLRNPAVGGSIICLLTLGVLLALQSGTHTRVFLQRPELMVYDEFVRQRARYAPTEDPHIVICWMTEDDLRKYGHPLDDAKLARLLQRIVDAGACVVGLDIWRDLPEPRTGELYPELEKALRKLENVICIESLSETPPPPAIADQSNRFAPNNLPFDHPFDGICRRAYLSLEGGLEESKPSLALVLASYYLLNHDEVVTLVDVPGSPAPLLRLGRTTFPRLTPNAGAYEGIEVRDYEVMIDWRAPQTYRTFSFGDVLENRLPDGALKDAIVLVGTTSSSVKDSIPTPVNTELRGVLFHAAVVNQLLRSALQGEPPTTWWPEGAKTAWIALCTLLGGLVGLILRSPWKLAPALLLLIAAILLTGREALFRGLWIPISTPAIGAFAAATFVASFAAFLERSDRRVMSTLFSRHVSREVLGVLWAERDQLLEAGRLKPQRITATVLFTDLKDYSMIAEDMDPPDLMNWVNEYMSCIEPLVELHGGFVNSYSGDAIMAVFGGPIPRTREEDIDRDAIRAVECALAMRRDLKVLSSIRKFMGTPSASTRIGIYTGPVITGSIGSRDRIEYAALGDTTNTAARLQSLGRDVLEDDITAPCVILVGDSTWQRLHGRFTATSLGPQHLKGKSKEVTVYSILTSAHPTDKV
jgi:adenylate cyclase